MFNANTRKTNQREKKNRGVMNESIKNKLYMRRLKFYLFIIPKNLNQMASSLLYRFKIYFRKSNLDVSIENLKVCCDFNRDSLLNSFCL